MGWAFEVTTMRNEMAKRETDERALDVERRLLTQALTRLDQAQRQSGKTRLAGRLIFGLDLTGSREAGLHEARIATAAMFDALKSIGKIALKLAYFRGLEEFNAGEWHNDPDVLCRSMLGLTCQSGETQIARLLQMVLGEDNLSGVVFVGDHCEDNPRELEDLARRLAKKSVPVFVFHECADHDKRALKAKPIFTRIAGLSNGLYLEFKPDSGIALREMLAGIAAFSASGAEGLEKLAFPKTPEARQLKHRLLLGSGKKAH